MNEQIKTLLEKISLDIDNKTTDYIWDFGIVERNYTLPCGTKVHDVINTIDGTINRYIQPVKTIEYIKLEVVINKDGATINARTI